VIVNMGLLWFETSVWPSVRRMVLA